MKIAVEGCAHGQLERIYDTIQMLEDKEGYKIDLLICCGDFQSSRNEADLRCMAVPPKYYDICSFYKYYTGEKVAPILTVFIGGNHEASNYLQELPYGGWVAPNIFYLGYGGVIDIAGVRIGGLSGIYKSQDFFKGHFEKSPYDESSKRSVYHIRNFEVFRFKQISQDMDIFLSHDWPLRITNYGNKEQLLSLKKFLRDDIESEQLGSKPSEELLHHLKPTYWFSAHLHCKFAAIVSHNSGKKTKFLALDKCLPKRKFLQIVDIPHDTNVNIGIKYDLEWLTILFLTNHLLSVKRNMQYMPGPNGNERWSFSPNEQEMEFVLKKMGNDLSVPKCFIKTAPGYEIKEKNIITQPHALLNPQTLNFCEKLSIDDPISLLISFNGEISNVSLNDNSHSFVNDSGKSEFSSPSKSSLGFSRISLNLPEPKNISKDISSDVCEEDIKCSGIEVSKDSINIESHNEDKPVNKKFKRRNESIYKNDQSNDNL